MRNIPELKLIAISDLTPSPVRRHSAGKLRKLKASIEREGMVVPIIVDGVGTIVDGHARVTVASTLGQTHVMALSVEHLPAADVEKVLRLSLNRLAQEAAWDPAALRRNFEILIELNFDLDLTGFDTVEVENFLEIDTPSTGEIEQVDASDVENALPISRLGDVWNLGGSAGDHRIACGDSRNDDLRRRLFGRDTAQIAFSDPPYNVPIAGHVSGLGRKIHEDFVMGCGEMLEPEFGLFLETSLLVTSSHLQKGSLIFVCIDWRGVRTLLNAADRCGFQLLNVAVWVKTNPGMGSFYRSQHELICVLKPTGAPHRNNIELGRHGRSRSNIWSYRGVNVFGPDRRWLYDHPTVKPSALISDILRDASRPGDIVFDGFLGSGSTLVAAERTRRRCFGIEIEPRFVDLAIRRWTQETGRNAVRGDGVVFPQDRQVSAGHVRRLIEPPKGGQNEF